MVFQILRSDGTLAYDLTKPNPLFPRAFVTAPGRGSGMTIPSLSRPVMIGCPTSFFSDSVSLSTNHWAFVSSRSMWKRDTTTTVKEEIAMLQRYEYSAIDPVGGAGDEIFDTPGFIIEGATLP
jgi:hypothetical protein